MFFCFPEWKTFCRIFPFVENICPIQTVIIWNMSDCLIRTVQLIQKGVLFQTLVIIIISMIGSIPSSHTEKKESQNDSP